MQRNQNTNKQFIKKKKKRIIKTSLLKKKLINNPRPSTYINDKSLSPFSFLFVWCCVSHQRKHISITISLTLSSLSSILYTIAVAQSVSLLVASQVSSLSLSLSLSLLRFSLINVIFDIDWIEFFFIRVMNFAVYDNEF